MDMKDIRAIGQKPKKPRKEKHFMPSPARIARMTAKFRAKRMKDMAETPDDDSCDFAAEHTCTKRIAKHDDSYRD
jgi:hypothetical protein